MTMTHHYKNPALRLACCLALAQLLAACGPSSTGGGKGSQVVATVNGEEITVMQLNRVLERTGVREVTPDVRRRAIDSLTSEALLVQAALDAKIDRDTAFVQSLENARRQLLAQIFAERMVYPKTVVTAAEISDYYDSEPLLFANRRKFRVTTFRAADADLTPQVESALKQVKSVDEVRGILDARGIKYETQLASISPEQLPVDELPTFAKASVGDLFINPAENGSVLLMSVTGIDDDVPLTLERAKPLIEEYLRNSRNRQATDAYLERARASAKIVYASPADAPAKPTLSADTSRAAE
jgi:EpsD family peptidyl-prolyl cis-trans isomerase